MNCKIWSIITAISEWLNKSVERKGQIRYNDYWIVSRQWHLLDFSNMKILKIQFSSWLAVNCKKGVIFYESTSLPRTGIRSLSTFIIRKSHDGRVLVLFYFSSFVLHTNQLRGNLQLKGNPVSLWFYAQRLMQSLPNRQSKFTASSCLALLNVPSRIKIPVLVLGSLPFFVTLFVCNVSLKI